MELGRIPAFEAHLDLARLPWRATKSPGVSWILVAPDEAAFRAALAAGGGEVVALIRMDPGCGYPPHRHLGDEEVLVLQGGYADELGEYRAGSWVRYPAGSSHAPVALGDAAAPSGPGNEVCVLFATARGGTLPL
ncbi:MAG: cupin domain-containing protein [Planctomycetes bacterium]|nr:cupin domain-containing protein [Planctomycetota bacterium]